MPAAAPAMRAACGRHPEPERNLGAADAPLPSLQAFQEPVHNPPTGAKRADAGALGPCKPSPGHKSCLWFACCAAPPFRTSWSAHEQAPCAAEGSWAGPPHWLKSLAPAWPAAETDQMRCAAQLRSRRPNFVSKARFRLAAPASCKQARKRAGSFVLTEVLIRTTRLQRMSGALACVESQASWRH